MIVISTYCSFDFAQLIESGAIRWGMPGLIGPIARLDSCPCFASLLVLANVDTSKFDSFLSLGVTMGSPLKELWLLLDKE